MADSGKLYPPINNDIPMQPAPMPVQPPMNPMAPMPQAPMNQMPQIPLGPTPTSVTCPSCGASVVTTVESEPGTHTHLMALLLCFLCVCFSCVPYLVDSCQNANHHCPNCNAFLGTYKR